MTIEDALLSFPNLYEAACLGGNTYQRQDELIQRCRDQGRRFLAVMPLRHMYRCGTCGMQQGEAVLHFEEPAKAGMLATGEAVWPSGSLFIETKRSEVHTALAHQVPLPEPIRQFLDAVV